MRRVVGWAILYMFVVLKIPVIALLWLVWWAVRAEPVPPAAERSDDGGDPKLKPRTPLRPRRGPHSEGPPRSPDRTRVPTRPAAVARR